MMPLVIAAIAALSVGGIVWYFVSDVKVRPGWQNGTSPLARFLDNRRRRKFNEQLPEVLATMSNALRAGFSMAQAFDSVVELGDRPTCEEFRILQQQLRVGMSFDDALASMSERVGSDDLTLVTTAILISRKTGGNVTEIFDKISDTIRGRQRIERKVRTLTAQGRFQGLIVSLMPLALGLIMTILKPGLMIPFFCSLIGVGCVVVTIILIALGWLVIRRIIRIDV